MSDKTTVSGPVKVEQASREQVALDLMKIISSRDARCVSERNNRKYWLTLYSQCLKATSGYTIESILKEE